MWGYRSWRMGRRGWLRPWVLSIIAKSPRNGAEIMDEIERMSWGGWRPSPGSVYPLLEEMVQEGLVRKRAEDGRYEITEKGKGETEWPFGFPFHQHAYSVEDMLNEINGYLMYFEDLKKSDKSKLGMHAAKLKDFADRLSKLSEQ